MSAARRLIFVYGTLRSGASHFHLLGADARFITTARTVPDWTLVDAGGFPGMVHKLGAPGVRGEVIDIAATSLPALDAYEGVTEGIYTREKLILSPISDAPPIEADTYIFQPTSAIGRPLPEIGSEWEA